MTSKFSQNNNNFSRWINIPKKSTEFDFPNYKEPEIKEKEPEINIQIQEEEFIYDDDFKPSESCNTPDIEMDKIYCDEMQIKFDEVEFNPSNKLEREPSLKLVVEKFLLKKKLERNGWTF
jgi:hypothetical protein